MKEKEIKYRDQSDRTHQRDWEIDKSRDDHIRHEKIHESPKDGGDGGSPKDVDWGRPTSRVKPDE